MDQHDIVVAAKYEREHANQAWPDPVLVRAAQIREEWKKIGLFHTNNATSVALALMER